MYFTNKIETFDHQEIEKAVKHAKEEYPNESVGAIIDKRYVKFANVSPSASNSFMLKDDMFNVAYMQGRVDCLIHSHHDSEKALATKEDQITQQEFDIPFGIIELKNNSPTHVVFWGDTLPIEPLIGRPFFYGVWDCYGLVRDWIRINQNVIPPNPPRDWIFWWKKIAMFEEYVKSGQMPYEFINLKDIEVGDILLYNVDGSTYMNHCGIVVEGGKVLHHFDGNISAAYPFPHRRQFLTLAVRHNKDWGGYDDQTVWQTG